LKSRTEILVPLAAIQAVPIAVIAWYRLHRYAWYRYSAIVSYDISDDKMRTNFSKMLKSNGAIRLQYSVYEISNTKRIVDNLVAKIEAYAKHFTADDSVILFNVDPDKLTKYGNAIHRDQAIVYF